MRLKNRGILWYNAHGLVRVISLFYDRLHRIQDKAIDGTLIKYSVYLTHDRNAVKVLRDLVLHYERYVTVFKGEMVDL